MVIGGLTVISKVYPSGDARATSAEPRDPAAPSRLTMTMGFPSSALMSSASSRGKRSVAAPAGFNIASGIILRPGAGAEDRCEKDGTPCNPRKQTGHCLPPEYLPIFFKPASFDSYLTIIVRSGL